jgi:hypothetical protein
VEDYRVDAPRATRATGDTTPPLGGNHRGRASCDGPPFAYDYGLRTARLHLASLGAPEPETQPYDTSKHEPIEEINIEPDGEQAQ